VSHLYSGRNRSSPASRFPADSKRIDTTSHIHGFAVSYRLHRRPGFRGLETRPLGSHGRWATHRCDKVPEEPSCSSSRKCTPGIAAVCRCTQPDRDNYVHGLRFPAGCRASLSDSERNIPISGAISRSARWPRARWLPSSRPQTHICSPIARTVYGGPQGCCAAHGLAEHLSWSCARVRYLLVSAGHTENPRRCGCSR
jgi:hypothetical protein